MMFFDVLSMIVMTFLFGSGLKSTVRDFTFVTATDNIISIAILAILAYAVARLAMLNF